MNSEIATFEIVPPELKLDLAKEAPDFETVFLERKKLLAQVENFDPVESVEDTPRMNEAKRLRLQLVKKRTFLDQLRKDMGDSARKKVNLVNEMFRSWIDENSGAEAYLKEQEDFAVNYEASRKAELAAERRPLLAQYTDPTPYDLGSMTESQWEATLAGAKMVWEAEQTRVREEQERLKAEADERRRLQEENAKLQADRQREQAEAAAVLQAEKDRAQKAIDATMAKERERARKERDAKEAAWKLEQERFAAQQKMLQEAADAERKQKEALERAEKERKDAEEALKKQAEADKKKALKAPDRTKLADLAEKLGILRENFPTVKSPEAEAVLTWFDMQLVSLEGTLRQRIATL